MITQLHIDRVIGLPWVTQPIPMLLMVQKSGQPPGMYKTL